MKITLIVAHDRNKAIGKDGDLPWHLPNDLKWFKKNTINKTVVMGRTTWDSLEDRYKPLPKRLNLVMTRNNNFIANGAMVCNSLIDALVITQAKNTPELMVVGGGKIYELFYPLADEMILTEVDTEIERADTHFVNYNSKDWYESFSEFHQQDEKHQYNYRFRILKRHIVSD